MKKFLVIMGLIIPVLFSLRQVALAGTIQGQVTATNPKYVNEVIIYIRKAEGSFSSKIKDSAMDQKNMKFTPKVLPILVGSTVTFQNGDSVKHNVFSPHGGGYDLGSWGKGETKTHTFTKPGVYAQLCNIHPEMEAHILVLQNPYFAQASKDGSFKIAGVPPGEYELKAWHYRLKVKPQSVKVEGGPVTVNFDL